MTVDAATDKKIRSAFSSKAGLENFQGNALVAPLFNDFITLIEQSSILVKDLINLVNANGRGSIVLGLPGGGTETRSVVNTFLGVPVSSNLQIVIDPDLFSAETLPQVATVLGHELGHATLPGGFNPYLNAPTASAAAAIEFGDEGVAEVNAYDVAKQLKIPLPANQDPIQADLDAAVKRDGAHTPISIRMRSARLPPITRISTPRRRTRHRIRMRSHKLPRDIC